MDIPFTDPTSLSFLPPRHDLESDSEGEDHHQPDSSRKADVPLEIALPSTPLECLIILVGKSALRFGQGLSGISNDVKGKVSQGDTALATLYRADSTHVLVLDDKIPFSAQAPLAAAVLSATTASSKMVIIDSYLPSTYINAPRDPHRDAPPIRLLATASTRNSSIPRFASPNSVTSPSAPFLSLSSSRAPSSHPALLLLPDANNTTLTTLASHASALLSIECSWDADSTTDLRRPGSKARQAEVSSMYM